MARSVHQFTPSSVPSAGQFSLARAAAGRRYRPPPATTLLAATVSSATHAKRDRECPGTDSAAAAGPGFTRSCGTRFPGPAGGAFPLAGGRRLSRPRGGGARGGEGGERRSAPVCPVQCRRRPRPDRCRAAPGRAPRYRRGRRRPGHERTSEQRDPARPATAGRLHPGILDTLRNRRGDHRERRGQRDPAPGRTSVAVLHRRPRPGHRGASVLQLGGPRRRAGHHGMGGRARLAGRQCRTGWRWPRRVPPGAWITRAAAWTTPGAAWMARAGAWTAPRAAWTAAYPRRMGRNAPPGTPRPGRRSARNEPV
jgi:hypothetical protein